VQRHKPAIVFILITLFLDVLGFGLLIPVAPALIKSIQDVQATADGAEAGLAAGVADSETAQVYWLLTVTYAAMQFVFAPVVGALSDVVGRRPVLLTSLAGSGLDYFAMALAPTLPWLFVTRAINGLSGASMTAAGAYIADVTLPQKRAAAFGMVGAAFGLGFIVGPLLGGWLGTQFGVRVPFYVAGAITLLNWCYGLFVVPESLPPERRTRFDLSKVNPLAAVPRVAKYPLVAWLAAAFFLSNVAQFGLHVTWVLYTQHRYGWSPFQTGLSLFIVGLGAAVVQGGLARHVIAALGEKRALLLSLTLGTLTFLGYGLATRGWMVYGMIVFGALAGVGMPAAQSLITRTVGPDEQGAVQGAMSSLQNLAQIVGPLTIGSIFAYFISEQASAYVPGAPFFAGAALLLASALVAWAALTRFAPPPMPPGPAGA
jgi:MFS transporter, DHA1 family, tetracycline resistance protein